MKSKVNISNVFKFFTIATFFSGKYIKIAWGIILYFLMVTYSEIA